MRTKNSPRGVTLNLIRPVLVLLRLGVFHYWQSISEEREVKRDKEKLTFRVPQRVPQIMLGYKSKKFVNRLILTNGN
jgi:hypothetical protein